METLNYWMTGMFSCAAFIIAAGAASAIRGHYNSSEWIWYIFAPSIAVGFSFFLVRLAHKGILPGARETAQQYGFLDFYLNVLRDEHRLWIPLQIFGVLTGVVATLAAAARALHYLALMNQRASGGFSVLWRLLARATLFSAKGGGIFFIVVVSVLSYLLLSGDVYGILRKG